MSLAVEALEADWGWMDLEGSGHVEWIKGTLAASYERAARYGGRYVLYSANPIEAYHAALTSVR